MKTLQTALAEALAKREVPSQAESSHSESLHGELAEPLKAQPEFNKAEFNRLVRICSPGSLATISYLCETARATGRPAKIQAAQKALLGLIGRLKGKLSEDDFVLLSEAYFQLHLSGVQPSSLGPGGARWQSPGEVFLLCEELHELDGYKSNVQRWC